VLHTGRAWQVADLAEAADEGWLARAYPGAAGEARLREGFRGHALIPLLVESRVIGILELDSRHPRRLDSDALSFVRLLANQAALLLEQARLRESEREQHGLEDDLAVARQIQLSLLPAGTPEAVGWAFAAAYQSARQVGGDLYDFIELPGSPPQLGLLIADVSGKGASAALFMAYSRAVIRAAAMRQVSPAQSLSLANEQLSKDNQAGLFISAFYGVLDTQSGRITYASAGHNPPLVWRAAARQATYLPTGGLVLGVTPDARYEDRQLKLEPGDVWVLYTDGITEEFDPNEELFGVERLSEAVAPAAPDGAAAVITAVLAAVDAFNAGTPQADDYTLVAVKRLDEVGQITDAR
jgi:serine phosphatase RsbU (regulator of sigma subunit)